MLSCLTLRDRFPFFCETPDSFLGQIQALTNEPLTKEIVRLFEQNIPDWEQILSNCEGDRYRNLYAAHLLGTKIDLIATTIIFLNFLSSHPGAKIKPYIKLSPLDDSIDIDRVEPGQRFIISKGYEENRSYQLSIEGASTEFKIDYAHLRPMLGFGSRRSMLDLLENGIHVVSFPFDPRGTLQLHGVNANPQLCLIHDVVHCIDRMKLVGLIGKEAYQTLLNQSRLFEEILKKLPPLTVRVNPLAIEPFFMEKGSKEEQIAHLIYMATGFIIDGLQYIHSPDELAHFSHIKTINRESIELSLKWAYDILMRVYTEAPSGFLRTDLTKNDMRLAAPEDFSPNLLQETLDFIMENLYPTCLKLWIFGRAKVPGSDDQS